VSAICEIYGVLF